MIGRYVIKKLCFILIFFLLIFGSLQTSFIQNKILKICFGENINVSFSQSLGIFPFNFSVKDLKISNKDFSFKTGNLHIKLSGKLTHIEKISIDKINVKSSEDVNISFSDAELLLPIFIQKIVKKIDIKEIDIDGEIFKNISFSYDQDLGIRYLELVSKHGIISSSWKFDKKDIFANAKFNDISFHALYGVDDRHLNLDLNYKTKKINFDGIWNEKSINGTLSLPFNDLKPSVVISLEDEFLEIAFREEKANVSGEIEYDFNRSIVSVNNVIFDNGTVVTPFSIVDFSKISEMSILLKKGKINFKNIDLSNDKFSLGNSVFSEIDLSQFKDLNIKGIINGTGIYQENKEKIKLNLKNFEYESFKIPSIDINSEHSKHLTNLSVVFNLLKKKNKIDVKLSTEDWIIKKDSKLNLDSNGVFDISDYTLASNQIASGQLTYKLKAKGSISKPIFEGNMDLKNCMYANPLIGAYIRDIELDCEINKNNVVIKKIYARDDSKLKGVIRGNGKILFNKDKLVTDVSLKIDNFKIVDQNWLKGRLFGTLALKGNLLEKVNISGDLFSKDPTIDISGIILLSMRSLDLLYNEKETTLAKSKCPIKFPIDIKFETRPELKITGFGINSSWIGNAKVTGDLFDINYIATAKLKKGKINVADNAFKLKDGNILIDKNGIDIFLSAEKYIEKILVGAKFVQKGDISKIHFYSSPYLSEKDIMSYMLFDKASSEISTSEGMALFSSMNKLSGNSGFDIIGKMKTILGIDSIAIKKNNDRLKGEYDALSIGKKIGKLKVSVDQGSGKDTTNVVVEADVAKNTKVSVDLSGRDSMGAGILWSKRY